MKKFLLLLFFIILLFCQKLFSENTIIEGKATPFAGRVIRLYAISDLVTDKTELITTNIISSEGSFWLQTELRDTVQCVLSVGFRKALLYLVPGSHYHCTVEGDTGGLLQQRLPVILQELPLRFDNLPNNELNRQIQLFDNAFERFLSNNANQVKAKNTRLINDSLRDLRKLFHARPGSFFDSYILYKTADLECMVNRWDSEMMFGKYLNDRPLLYHHPVYMAFFNTFFEHYFKGKSKGTDIYLIRDYVNQTLDLATLTDHIGKDRLLINERIRELVLLKNLGELYYDPEFLSQNILSMIKKIGEDSKYPEHSVIAGNMVAELTKLTPGAAAEGFSFIDQNKKERTLGDFRGKWVYLHFFTTWCEPCLAEMQPMPALYSQFNEKVEFIGICCNENPLDLTYYLAINKSITWPVFSMNDDIEIADAFRLMSFPLYVLIDPQGNIFQYQARSPVNQLKNYLESVIK